MGAYSVAAGGGLKKPRTVYPNMGLTSPYIYGALVPIASQVGTASGVEILFSSIPSTYQDLRLVINAIPSNAGSILGIYANQTTGNTCSTTWLKGDGATPTSARATGNIIIYPGGTNSTSTTIPTIYALDILNYANTSRFKTVITRTASDLNGSGYTTLSAGLIQTTSAINALSLSTLNGGYFWTGNTTATLYGIRAANS
jgi:hypothetical protein